MTLITVAVYELITINQGASFEKYIDLKDVLTGANLNIAGYNVSCSIKKSYYSENVTANIVCTVTNSQNGVIKLSLASANTSNLKPGKYLYDVITESPSGFKERIREGMVIVTPGITGVQFRWDN